MQTISGMPPCGELPAGAGPVVAMNSLGNLVFIATANETYVSGSEDEVKRFMKGISGDDEGDGE